MLVAVPYRESGCSYRAAAWETVEAHLRTVFPDAVIRVVDDGGDPFARGNSLNQAFDEVADHDVVVACDADLVINAAQLHAAVDMAAAEPGMVIPFDQLEYIDRVGASQVWKVHPMTPLLGGCNVLTKHTWTLAGGWLSGFRGWCAEDVAFATQCSALVAHNRRVPGRAVHLYHPKSGEYVDPARVSANGALMRKVLIASDDHEKLRQVIREQK